MEERKVALITGANSGVGLSLADRLLTEYPSIRICLACRNTERAKLAQRKLLQRHNGADVSIITVDTSNVNSVFQASEQIMERYSRLDYLYLNAGIMPVSSINWDQVLAIFSLKGKQILTTGFGCLNHEDNVTRDGLKTVFATNLFGHYVMVRELEDFLGRTGKTQIVWTSSRSAHKDAFNIEDIQHENGNEPYSSSKYATDAVSIALNERLNQKVTCRLLITFANSLDPEEDRQNVGSDLDPNGMLSMTIDYYLLCFKFNQFDLFTEMRIFVSSLTCSAYNGCEALVWLTKQRVENLDPRRKYCSQCSVFFKPYVTTDKLDVSESIEDKLYKKLDSMYLQFKKEYKKTKKQTKTNIT